MSENRWNTHTHTHVHSTTLRSHREHPGDVDFPLKEKGHLARIWGEFMNALDGQTEWSVTLGKGKSKAELHL